VIVHHASAGRVLATSQITATFGRGASMNWLGASYALAMGVLLMVGGRYGDR